MNFIASLLVKCEENELLNLFEESEALASEIGWENLLNESYRTLCSFRFQGLWYGAARIFYYAIKNSILIYIDQNELIARLYWCLRESEKFGYDEDFENIILEIVAELKGISSTSSWKPINDPAISELLAQMK